VKLQINSGVGLLVGLALIGWGVWQRSQVESSAAIPTNAIPVFGQIEMGRSCTVVPGSVYDGDTLRVLCDGEEIKIRMCGIDAPEVKPKQPLGIESRDKLRELLPDGAMVSVVEIERDRYGRMVAEVWNDAAPGEQFINGAMVLAGMAHHYRQYSSNCPGFESLVLAEELARSQSLGVFAPGNVEPWEWRKRTK